MFVNAFYQACDVTLTREKCQQRAVEAWKEVKSDVKLQKKFMATGPHERMHILHKPVVKDHRVVNFFVPSQNLHAAGGEQSEAKGGGEGTSNATSLASVDPSILRQSGLLMKDDFAQQLYKMAKLIDGEVHLANEWKLKYEEMKPDFLNQPRIISPVIITVASLIRVSKLGMSAGANFLTYRFM